MAEPVGILLEKRTLHLARRGAPTYEHVSLYREIALRGGPDVVLFTLDGMHVGSRRVHGYVPTIHGWERVVVRMPDVIHKRVLFPLSTERALRRRWRQIGTVVINPPLMNDKARMHMHLFKLPHVRDYLPLTEWYRVDELDRRLDNGATVILKPRIGSVGKGIARLTPVHEHVLFSTEHGSRMFSRKQLRAYLAGRTRRGMYLLQQYIPLARYGGHPFDLRVPVQRDRQGAWVIAGIVAKVAVRHPFLTNLAQGGRAIPAVKALKRAFSPAAVKDILHNVRQLAVHVAEGVARRFPDAADLGLDIGVDKLGKPWLIEVNTRDQRITFLQAGMHDAFRAVYEHPVTYCAYAIAHRRHRQS